MYAFLGDVHLGVKLNNEDFAKSLDMFLGLIKSHKEECNGIFVAGDLFDHKLSVKEMKFASYFIANLACNYCGRNGKTHVPVYFVHGTYTHDQEQYTIYLPMLEKMDNVEVFYIENACEFTLFDGRKVLFLPQEYGDVNYDKFFGDGKMYDMIIGHGPIASNTKNPCKSARYEIVHSAELLGEHSKLCVFGHYHGYTDFGNGVYYTGPWLQWKYGEDEENVFFFCDNAFTVETVVNPYAMKFHTVDISDVETLREYLSQDITEPYRFCIESKTCDMETYRGIINSNTNGLIKFQVNEIVDEDDLQLTVDECVTYNQSETATQPVPALISYIKDKYGVDTTDQLCQYENMINKEKKEEVS